jgi:hypothetical protein
VQVDLVSWTLDENGVRLDSSTETFSGASMSHTVTLAWTPATLNTDGSAVTGPSTFNLYQGTAAPLTKVQSGLTAPTATVTAGLTPGTTQEFAVTQVDNGVESAESTIASVAIPFSTPDAPTGLTLTLS